MIIIFHQAGHSFSPSNSVQRENQNNIYFYCVTLLHFPFCLFLLMTLIAIIRNDRSPTTNEKLQFTSWTRCKRHDIKKENGMSREWQFRPMEEGWQASYRSRSLLQYGACHDPAGSIHHVDRSRGGRQRQVNDIQFSPRWDSFVRIVTREVLICDLNGFPLFFFLLSLLVKFIDGLNVIGMFLFQLFLLRDWNLFTYFSFFFFFVLRKCKS